MLYPYTLFYTLKVEFGLTMDYFQDQAYFLILPFPEAEACTKVLLTGEQKEKSSNSIYWGMGFGGITKVVIYGFKFAGDAISIPLIIKTFTSVIKDLNETGSIAKSSLTKKSKT